LVNNKETGKGETKDNRNRIEIKKMEVKFKKNYKPNTRKKE
jgi:hypothetical protein